MATRRQSVSRICGFLFAAAVLVLAAACGSASATLTPTQTALVGVPVTPTPTATLDSNGSPTPVTATGPSIPTIKPGQAGTVKAWGDDSGGQTEVPAGLTGVVSIAAGDEFSLCAQAAGCEILPDCVVRSVRRPSHFG